MLYTYSLSLSLSLALSLSRTRTHTRPRYLFLTLSVTHKHLTHTLTLSHTHTHPPTHTHTHTGHLSSLIASSTRAFPWSVTPCDSVATDRKMLTLCGETEESLAQELLQFEVQIERDVVEPLFVLAEVRPRRTELLP